MKSGTPEGHRLAVLPLANISPDPNDEYFTDGMTEELISTLSRIAGLRVIARTSAMRYKGSTEPIRDIARTLRVRSVVQGSVRKAGDRLRISVQLIDAESEEHVWSNDYDRELTDVFAVQSDIAERIARALRVEIRRQETQRLATARTRSAPAYTAYLQGRVLGNTRTEAALRDAVRHYERAVAIDPTFVAPLAGIAEAYAALALAEAIPPSEAFPKAREYAERALSLDDALAEGHAALGLVRFQYDWSWGDAEREFRRAIALNPNLPQAHQYLADLEKALGRFSEAQEEMRRALELDPVSLPIQTGLGHVLYLSRQNDRAIEQYRAALALDPRFVNAHLWFGRPYLEKGMFEEAISELRQAVALSDGSTITLAVLGHALASAGRTAEAREVLDRLLRRAETSYLPSYWIALVHAGLHDDPEALRWLDRAFAERSSWLAWIGVEPRFDRLRQLPEFRSLLQRMRLPEPAAKTADPAVKTGNDAVRELVTGFEDVRIGRYAVVGRYARFDDRARNQLKDVRTKIAQGLLAPSARRDNFLLWAPPGSGKTHLVREVARTLEAKFLELNLAEVDEVGFRAALASAEAEGGAQLVFVDEIDGRPGTTWAYEALLPFLDPGNSSPRARVTVLAGSTGATLDALEQALQGRPKGSDLLSRVPEVNRVAIPPMSSADRILVALSTVQEEAVRAGKRVSEAERLALYYLVLDPALGNARQLREFIVRAVERVPVGEERLRYDNLFVPGDPRNKEFWLRARSEAPSLLGSFVRFEP